MSLTTNGSLDIKTSNELRSLLKAELSGGVEVSADWAHSLYLDAEGTERIEGYLETSKLYNEGRWEINIPNSEVDLYDPWRAIINSIFKFFGMGGRREALDTHGVRLFHASDPLDCNPEPHNSSPDLSVIAYGPSFVPPSGGKKIGFGNMASFFDGKIDSKMGSISEHLTQMGVYARYVLILSVICILT